jgi:hypothetical protein
MFATPIAYLIEDRGCLVADVASGADAIQALMSGAAVAAQKEVVAIQK